VENVEFEDGSAGQVEDGFRKEDFVFLYACEWQEE
jgi:hypothetical protein